MLVDFDGRGTPPDSALHATLAEISKSHRLATTASSSLQPALKTMALSNGFPGQGLAPYVKPPVSIDYGVALKISPSTFINRNLKVLDTSIRTVRIGERCLIGPDFHIYAVSHPLGAYLIKSFHAISFLK
jgi:maltose O-acetyltransferase